MRGCGEILGEVEGLNFRSFLEDLYFCLDRVENNLVGGRIEYG